MRKITLKEQKKILLDIMDAIDRVCVENNIKYYLIGGTLIGAIRHKGFIPWDDDIDIGLLRDDYQRFINIFLQKNRGYDLYSCFTHKNYCMAHSKICDKSTIIDEHIPGMVPTGVYVDIFPLDYCPGDYEMARAYTQKVSFWRDLLTIKNMSFSKRRSLFKNLFMIFVKVLFFGVSSNYIARRINSRLLSIRNTECTKYIAEATLMPYGEKEIYNIEWFRDVVRIDFEDRKYFAPIEYKSVLSKTFGDYMKIPPIDQRPDPHGDAWWKE